LPENPLLPNRKLRELYTLIERCRALDRRRPHPAAREALLAATTMQLLPGDILCAAPSDATLAKLAPANRSGLVHGGLVTPPNLPFATKLTTAASMARGQLAASFPDALSLTLAFSVAGTLEPGWQHALSVAHHVSLPLLLAVADATGGATSPRVSTSRKSEAPPLDWPNMQRLARKLRLPVFAVDGEDAVAVYRVMQESVMRARSGGGPAVLWAVLSPQRPARSHLPLARLQAYLAARHIPLHR
jgi:pyruvate dehydrogenase E1 component alpha subunit